MNGYIRIAETPDDLVALSDGGRMDQRLVDRREGQDRTMMDVLAANNWRLPEMRA